MLRVPVKGGSGQRYAVEQHWGETTVGRGCPGVVQFGGASHERSSPVRHTAHKAGARVRRAQPRERRSDTGAGTRHTVTGDLNAPHSPRWRAPPSLASTWSPSPPSRRECRAL